MHHGHGRPEQRKFACIEMDSWPVSFGPIEIKEESACILHSQAKKVDSWVPLLKERLSQLTQQPCQFFLLLCSSLMDLPFLLFFSSFHVLLISTLTTFAQGAD